MSKISPNLDGETQRDLINKQRLINDYIMLSFLLGNDFLHNVPSMRIGDGGVDFVLNLYSKIFPRQRNYLVLEKDGNFTINHRFLLKIFEKLSYTEPGNLKYLQAKKRVPRVPAFESTYQEEKFKMDRIPLNERFQKYFSVIDYRSESWRKDYYKIFFDVDVESEGFDLVLDHVIQNYLEGLNFTIKYYFEGNPSWYWYNPYPVSPFASDIFKLKESKRNKNRQLNRHFGEVLAQWAGLKERSKQYHLKEAEKHKNLKNAQLLLDLAKPNSLEASL